eukprot:6386835-Amphidinium_carterae.1
MGVNHWEMGASWHRVSVVVKIMLQTGRQTQVGLTIKKKLLKGWRSNLLGQCVFAAQNVVLN